MTFCFYLRNHEDYQKFERFMVQGKQRFMEEWIFSSMETKPAYMKKQKSSPQMKDKEVFEEVGQEFFPKA